MEAGSELAELASTAAGQLISLLTKDGWATVKASIVSLWRHSHPEHVDADLTQARGELLAAVRSGTDRELSEFLANEWRGRLGRLLITQPEAADELRRIIREDFNVAGSAGHQVIGSMTLETHVSGGGDANVAGRDMTITKGGPE